MATYDLSGCTVAVLSTPAFTIMAHVWERRADDWNTNPWSDEQKAKDAEFIAKGVELVSGITTALKLQDYVKADSASLHIVTPGENPDYALSPWDTLWYLSRTNGLVYQNAAEGLYNALVAKYALKPTAGEVLTYRRRYSNDPAHTTDDRDIIALVPFDYTDGTHWLQMAWDEDKIKPIQQICIPPSSLSNPSTCGCFPCMTRGGH